MRIECELCGKVFNAEVMVHINFDSASPTPLLLTESHEVRKTLSIAVCAPCYEKNEGAKKTAVYLEALREASPIVNFVKKLSFKTAWKEVTDT